MAEPIVIPRLGLAMEAGRLVEWYVEDGEMVEKGKPLFAVETDKVVMEVEALASGIVHHRPDASQDMMPIGTLIGYIAQPGETVTWPEQESQDAVITPATEVTQQVEGAGTPGADGERRASPAARRRAAELGIDWRALAGSSRDGHVLLADVEKMTARAPAAMPITSAPTPGIQISPVAQRAAAELGVDVQALAAQFPGKRLGRKDVERVASQKFPTSSPMTWAPIPHVRRIIAERMAVSAHTTAPVTLTTEADATELVRLRTQLKNDPVASTQPVPSYNDLLAKLVAQALLEHPSLNARLEEDEILISSSVRIGLATDTERGLMVPVLQDVQVKSLRHIAEESAALIERAHTGQLELDDLRGGTFTITNLGMYDIDAFTPIINLPETAILGVGRIVPKQIVVDADAERVAIRKMMFLSLTFDHRLVDGAPAARFLQRIKQYVEQPYLWLTT